MSTPVPQSPAAFAFAGMNAHINHDLSLALVQTCEELGGGLDASRRTDSPPRSHTRW